MSSWFVWVLTIFICIGGMQGMHNIIMAVLLRSCRRLGRKSVKLPLVGTVSWMSLLVNIICLAFAVFWFVKRHTSYAWVGQDILPCKWFDYLTSRYDKFKKRVVSSGYFLWLTIGYGVGLLQTYLGLYLMDGHGQPALL